MILFDSKNALVLFSLMATSNVNAEIFGGIDFPNGAVSFADSVVTYDPSFGGGAVPTDLDFTNPIQALGPPDYANPIGSVSLGSGGQLILQFIDNKLTGSDNADPDLHIFEIGPDVEDTFIDISKDGNTWSAVGKVFGSTSSIDIDAFGFGTSDEFAFVRLTDDKFEGQTSGPT